ncbi:MAG: beta family protein [Candidatus Sumerlaeia bacterium]
MFYIPILKDKQGERAAIASLADKSHIVPLIEVNDLSPDVEKKVRALKRCWPGKKSIYIDVTMLDGYEYKPVDLTNTIARFLDLCIQTKLEVVPVIRTMNSSAFYKGVGTMTAQHDPAHLCLRLVRDDFADSTDAIRSAIDNTISATKTDPTCIDVIIDGGDISGQKSYKRVAKELRGMVEELPYKSNWKSITIASGAFPADLSSCPANQWNKIERTDWLAWESLIGQIEKKYAINYGDYGINNVNWPPQIPVPPSAQLRYSTESEFMVYRAQRRDGNEAFYNICDDLVNLDHEFYGPEFSDGDRLIAEKADRNGGPGNASTWRQIGTSHHLALVLASLARISGS